MAQSNYNIPNESAPAVRAQLNAVFQSIATNNSGSSAPTTTFAHQWWYDTTTNILKQRNAADTAWIDIGTFDQSGGTFVASVTQLSQNQVEDDTSTVFGTVSGQRLAQAVAEFAPGPELLVPFATLPGSGSGQIDIPPWANEIEVAFQAVTWTRNDFVMVQVGTASDWFTTGYASLNSASFTVTDGMTTRGNSTAHDRWGTNHLRSISAGKTRWQWSGSEWFASGSVSVYSGRTPDLPSPLTRIRIVGRGGAGTLGGGYAVIVRR